jgi:hypothetical protein
MLEAAHFSRHPELVKKGKGVVSSTLSLLTKPFQQIPVGSLVNKSIDLLPVELHIPGYQYCGPGTKLKKRLARGDPGINKLDQACKQHDIAYSKFADSTNRSIADRVLAEKAWQRVKSSDASVGEKAAALAVAAAMRGKTAIGGGRKRRRGKRSSKKRGGNIRRRRRSNGGNKKTKPSIWSMLKKGQGLYLRPYRVY